MKLDSDIAMRESSMREAIGKFTRMVKLMRPFWFSIIKDMGSGVLIQVLGMITPYLSKLLIDEVYPSQNISLMNVLVGGILAISVTITLMRSFRSYFNLYLNAHLNNTLTLEFFNHIQHLKARFFDEHRIGEIASRFQDVSASLNTVTQFFQTVFLSGIYLLLVPPFLFLINWKLALLALVGVPLNVYLTYLSGRSARPYLKQTAEAYSDLRGFQVEVLGNIRTMKTMALENYVYHNASRRMRNAMTKQLKAARIAGIYGAINGLVRGLSTALYTWYGWHLVFSNQLTLGEFIAFTAYIGYLYGPLSDFFVLLSEFQQSSVSFDRMFEYLDAPPEQDPSSAKTEPSQVKLALDNNIELKEVSFGYTDDAPVLKEINLRIKSGSVTAIVGPSGSGKTSLLRLLTRLDEAQAGRILIDGVSIDQIPLSDLRRQMSVVWQEVGLIQGNIWDNLTLGLESPPVEQVFNAVRVCRLESLIMDLSPNSKSEIAERGATLSAGQRQRLAIARALIRDTPILILDEATANIDVETEIAILNNIFSNRNGKTIIFVSHRLASAALADQICVLDGGRVVEVGSHCELLNWNSIYRKMHDQHKAAEPLQSKTFRSV